MRHFSWLADSMKGRNDPVLACKFINDDLKKWFRFNEELSVYPSALDAANLLQVKMGRCLDQAAIANFAMRAMGIPVVHEVVPQWGNRSLGHDFSAVIDRNGQFIDFLGAELSPGENELRGMAPKVFRQMFSIQNQRLSQFDDGLAFKVGSMFGRDVTSEYLKTGNVSIQSSEDSAKDIFLAVFDDSRWVPVKMGHDSSGNVLFEDMAIGVLYLPCFLDHNLLIPLADPLYLDSSGTVHKIIPKPTTEIVTLERKYPLTAIKRWWMTLMGNGQFEGANKPDFSDKFLLYSIADTIELKFHQSKTFTHKPVRYVRYRFPENCFGSLGEISFYEPCCSEPLKGVYLKAKGVSDDDLSIAFDEKMDRFIHTSTKDEYNSLWIGLDLGSPKSISMVGYSPRSDQNNIEKGMEYELMYWDANWRSLGRTVATQSNLVYKNVPEGALLLLRNHTAGKEERIFLYENGKQVWF